MRSRDARTVAAVAMALLAAGMVPPANAAERPGMPNDADIYRTIEDITAQGPRRQGSRALDFAVGYVRDQFRSAGLTDVHVEETPSYSWVAKSASLEVAGKTVPAFPVAYSQSPTQTATGDFATPPGGLDARLVDGGMGTPADLAGKDVTGKIVVFDLKFTLPTAAIAAATEFLWDPENTLLLDPLNLTVANPYQTTYTTAIGAIQAAGAAGFVGVLADYFDSNRYYNEYYGSLNVKLPGLWVTKKAGADLRARITGDPAARAKLSLQTRKEMVPSHAVVGYLEGKSKDTILVTSHHDSVWQGAVEDGSGTAEVIALAKYYGSQPASERQKSMMFTTFDSHFSGYQAHDAFAYRHVQHRTDADEPHRLVAVTALEHIARHADQDADGKLRVTDLNEALGVFENLQPPLKATLIRAVVDHDFRRSDILNAEPLQAVGIPTDANWALLGGLPTASLISGPNYLYDEQDTLDKIQKNYLQKAALVYADLIDGIDETPSDQIGLPPVNIAKAKGPASIDAVEKQPVPKPARGGRACRPAHRGPAVSHLALRGRAVTFTSRRSFAVRVRIHHGDGRATTVPNLQRVTACRRYRLRVALDAVAVRITWRGGTANAHGRK